jgi:hypothetical protein
MPRKQKRVYCEFGSCCAAGTPPGAGRRGSRTPSASPPSGGVSQGRPGRTSAISDRRARHAIKRRRSLAVGAPGPASRNKRTSRSYARHCRFCLNAQARASRSKERDLGRFGRWDRSARGGRSHGDDQGSAQRRPGCRIARRRCMWKRRRAGRNCALFLAVRRGSWPSGHVAASLAARSEISGNDNGSASRCAPPSGASACSARSTPPRTDGHGARPAARPGARHARSHRRCDRRADRRPPHRPRDHRRDPAHHLELLAHRPRQLAQPLSSTSGAERRLKTSC